MRAVAKTGRGRAPQTDMAAEQVLALLERLEAAGIRAWVDGGWAVDALLRSQTRSHDDLDLVVRLEDTGALERVLGGLGYSVGSGAAPFSFELVDADGRQVDVHPFATSPSGDGRYRLADGGTWIYPAEGFGGTGRILGREVRCLTPEVVLVNHTTGYALDEDHQRDARALAAYFDLPLPSFRTA